MSTTDPDEVVPTGGKDELDKWNWGAFLWSWVWAIGHRQWFKGIVSLIVSLVIPLAANIYLALKGNRLAWETGTYASKEELRAKERAWVKAWFIVVGVIVAIVVVVALAGGFDSSPE